MKQNIQKSVYHVLGFRVVLFRVGLTCPLYG